MLGKEGLMKQGLRLAALAALAASFAGPAAAALISYDVSGTGSLSGPSAFATTPPGCSTTTTVNPCLVVAPFVAGSFVTLQNDKNGDGVAGDYEIAASSLHVTSHTEIFGGAIIFDTDTTS